MKKMKYILHGTLFSLCSGLIIYVFKSDSSLFINPIDLIYPTIFSLFVFILFLFIGYLVSRNLKTSGLFASILVLGLFYIWPVFLVILISYLATFLLLKFLLKKPDLIESNLILNFISIVLVCITSTLFINQMVGIPRVSRENLILPVDNYSELLLSDLERPDIYYIIMDGYGREDILLSVLGFDNSLFIDSLDEKGFFVAPASQANYPRTVFSLSSSLNMQYLDPMAQVMGNSSSWWPIADTIQHSEVRNILEDMGYKTIFFSSGWDFTDIRDGDRYEAAYPIMLKNFENPFLNFTNLNILRNMSWLGISYPSYDTHRNTILYIFSQLPNVASIPGPKFVFAHILAPHPPYVFKGSGETIDPDYPFSLIDAPKMDGDTSLSQNNYLEQLQFVNDKIMIAITGIIENSKNPPVIILQGDHGSGIFFDYNSITNSCLRERYSILNAYYLPGNDKGSIPEDISPVNSFRFIFNHYFQADFEILHDQQYFSSSKDFYQFTDISGLTGKPCGSGEN